ncbi:MAG: glycosyltransferase [Lutibacter sp.]|uniref:glycosyltransferase family 2 protein n=1 Tax=Lutibacter sp. TaxID=1925666 RepID=UPI003858802C
MSTVSIILPSYNHAKFLKKRLVTIVNQTYNDWELIIIDDCSTDDSLKILKDFIALNKSKVSYFIVNKINTGSGYTSWQKGIELATSKYIWIAETDDYSNLYFLEEQINILEKTDAVISFCTSNYVDINENYLYNSDKRTSDLGVKKGDYKVFDSKVFNDRTLFNTYITNGSSVVFRKPIIKVPDEIFSYKQSSDQFLWTFLLQHNTFVFLNKNLNYFRRHENSTTEKLGNTQLKQLYIEKIAYLIFFNLKIKTNTFLRHYIRFYVWKNKRDIFDVSVVINLRGARLIKIKYFLILVKFILVQFYKKLWKCTNL